MRTPTGKLDYSNFIMHSDCSSFKNKRIYTGTFTISGSINPGLNERFFNITLDESPDFLDVIYNGPTDTVYNSDPRPNNAWTKTRPVYVISNNAEGGNPQQFVITYSVVGNVITFRATNVWQSLGSEILTPTNVSYRIIDYIYT